MPEGQPLRVEVTKSTLECGLIPVIRFLLLLISIPACSLAARATEPPVTAVDFSHDGAQLVAVSQAGLTVYAWPSLEPQRNIELEVPNLHAVRFSPAGSSIAIGGGFPSEEGVVHVLSWPEGKPLAHFNTHEDSVRRVEWLDESNLVTASLDRTIKIWSLDDPSSSVTLTGHSRSVDAICLLPDQGLLVSAGADQSLRVWDLNDHAQVRSLNQHTGNVHDLARNRFRRGLPMIASSASDRTIRFWQPTIGRLVRFARLDAVPLSLAWLPDGKHLLVGCDDGTIRTVDSLGLSTVSTHHEIDGWVYAVRVHATDGSVAVAGTNGRIRRLMIDALVKEDRATN